jgi:hypothetical protein
MTRKDYERIANSINAATSYQFAFNAMQSEEYQQGFRHGAQTIIAAIAEAMQAENPRFSKAKFYAACGVSE